MGEEFKNVNMPKPIIKIKDLEITYNLGKENEYRATRGVTMDIYPGEYVAFFGPSGCGKSTIMYSILGILKPSAGELLVNGENPYTYSADQMVGFQTKTVGIIYQAFYLINSISVVDNVALPQTFMGVAPNKRRKWANSLLTRFGLGPVADKYPDNLSGGQMQRVSVARSIVNKPNIVLANEPTGHLDSVATQQVMEILDEINGRDKRTVIIITHNAAQLIYAHRVFYMKDGKLARTVPNPEKKQIAKINKQTNIVTEIDQLSKLYPYSPPTELKVKSLVNYLTQDLNFDQIERLEEFLEMILDGKMGGDEFVAVIAKDYEKGGVGVTAALAKVMEEKISKMLKHAEDVRRYRRRFEKNLFFDREDNLVDKLTKYVLTEFSGEALPKQLRLLKEAVRQRISGILKKEDFHKQLDLSLEEGGVGFKKQTAENITNYFEKIIAQGIQVEGKH